jgi:pimeloyl-[acyl-carrier protein] methyl ester esterase
MNKQNKTALLFVHGWATDKWVWSNQIEAFGESRKILNINLPGHGGKISWNEPTLAPPVHEVSNHLSHAMSDDFPKKKIIGIGWSLGAQVLLISAVENLNKFSGLILISATPCFVKKNDFPWGQPGPVVKKMIADIKKRPCETIKRFYPLNFTDEELKIKDVKDFINRYSLPNPKFKFDEMTIALEALSKADMRDHLRLLDVPVLIIHGKMDEVCPVEAATYLADKIKGADLQLFEKAGHAPFLTEKAKFKKVISGFIDKL